MPTLNMDRQQKLIGCTEPRIWTPPLRELHDWRGEDDPATSLGYSCIKFAEQYLRIELDPWQKWLLIHALEVHADGTFRFRKVVVLVGRQNGKSTLSQVLALWCMYVLGIRLTLGTAQDLDTATETWQGAVDLVQELDDDEEPVRPELAALVKKVNLTNGKHSLDLTTGERYKIKAANRRAGRGLTGDLILLDELREHQTWDAWAAITNTTNARPNAQIWALSNAGDATSVVLRYLRKMAHKVLGDPDGINALDDPEQMLAGQANAADMEVEADDTLGIFEWSAQPGKPIRDREGWRQANPSLGHGRVTERTLLSTMSDPEWVVRTEVLCQWSDSTLEGPFPAGTWDGCKDTGSHPRADSPLVLCVDVSWDRATTHVALAGIRDDGLIHVELVASRAGTEWVIPWIRYAPGYDLTLDGEPRDPRLRGLSVVVQATGAPVSSLLPAMTATQDAQGNPVEPIPVIEWRGTDLGKGTGGMYDLVRAGQLRHRGQPLLDLAAATAVTRPNGDAYVWDRKGSTIDAAPLVAATGAVMFVTTVAGAAYDVLQSVF